MKSAKNKDLRISVLLKIAFMAEIRWKKKIDNIFIRVYSKFRERGIPNSLSDVVPIEKEDLE